MVKKNPDRAEKWVILIFAPTIEPFWKRKKKNCG
jgi:hypothetical protein